MAISIILSGGDDGGIVVDFDAINEGDEFAFNGSLYRVYSLFSRVINNVEYSQGCAVYCGIVDTNNNQVM